jgi:class 3 adenylate cyclase
MADTTLPDQPDHLVVRPGVRPLPIDTVRYLARMGGVLYLVCGLSVIQIGWTARDSLASPTAHLALSTLVVAMGALTVGLVGVLSDATLARLYPAVAYTLVFAAPTLVSLGLHTAGVEQWNTGSGTFLIAPIFGFYVLETAPAWGLVAAVGAQYGLVLRVGGGDVPAPASQWVFLMSIVVTTALLVARLVDRSDRVGSSERALRLALADSTRTLEARVAEQVDEIAQLDQLRRFLPTRVAEAVVSRDCDDLLQPHRRRIAALFCDLRGFTRFAATAEPEEIVELLEAYYDAVVTELAARNASIGAFAGDGIMAYFGDLVADPDPVGSAVEVAVRLREALDPILGRWQRRGFDLGYGVGIAYGYATLGMIGAEGRSDYTALGSVVNLASPLCDEAGPHEILLDQRAHDALGESPAEPCTLTLKGFSEPVRAYRLVSGRGPLRLVRPDEGHHLLLSGNTV